MTTNGQRVRWTTVRLGDAVNEISTRIDNPSEAEADRFVGLEHFDSGELKIRRWGTTADLISAMKVFKAGDTLFARRNAYLRRASMVDFDGVCSGDAIVLRPKESVIIGELLPAILNTDTFWEYALSHAAGSMSKRVNIRNLLSYEFALPPLEEQKRIVSVLWAADDVVEKYSAVDKALLSEQHALLTQYMPPDAPFEALRQGRIPGICSGRLRDMCEKITDGTHQPPVFTKTGVPFLLIENITQGGVDWSVSKWISEETYARLTKTLRPQRGDVLYTVVGRFGDAILVDWDRPFAFQRHIAVIRPRTGVLDSRFLCYFLESNLGKKQASIYAEGLAQKTITLGSLGKFCIPTPPIEVQIRICRDLDAISARRTLSQDASESCKRLLAEMRNALIAGVAHV